jgi:hypothetical protein
MGGMADLENIVLRSEPDAHLCAYATWLPWVPDELPGTVRCVTTTRARCPGPL